MTHRPPSQDVIRLEEVTKTYRSGELDVPVLKGINLTIKRGDMVALMGLSGSGKTTLMNILGCLDRPTTGRYWFDGDEVSHYTVFERASLRSRKIGFVFQNYSLLARTTALDNLMVPVAYLPAKDRPPRRDSVARAEQLLAKVGLAKRMDHMPSQLSGGEQQRVSIARSLINDPVVLLADEPTGNLDTKNSEGILKLFQDLNEEQNLTIMLVTHSVEVAEHAKRIVRVRDGRIEGETVVRGGFSAPAPTAETPAGPVGVVAGQERQ